MDKQVNTNIFSGNIPKSVPYLEYSGPPSLVASAEPVTPAEPVQYASSSLGTTDVPLGCLHGSESLDQS